MSTSIGTQEKIGQATEGDSTDSVHLHLQTTSNSRVWWNYIDHRKCPNNSSELSSVDTVALNSIKQESEDLQYNCQLQAENVPLKDEMDIEEHKPYYELTGRFNAVIFKDDLDRCDSVQNKKYHASESKGDAKFNCAHCPYKTCKKSNYIAHYVRKHKQCTEMYKCVECHYESKIKSNLVRHFKYNHFELLEMPEYNNMESSGETKYKNTVKQTKVYKCDESECAYETKKKSDLTRHHKCKHAKEIVVYKCNECSYETCIDSDLTKHYKYKHDKEAEVYKCRECAYETRIKDYLNQHYKYKHATETKEYKCDVCSYQTRRKSNLITHYKCKHAKEGEVYKCEKCSFETKYKPYLTRHHKRKHSCK